MSHNKLQKKDSIVLVHEDNEYETDSKYHTSLSQMPLRIRKL